MNLRLLKLATLITFLILHLSSFSQNTTYRVVRGERPFIDLHRVSKDSYANNKLQIKIAAQYEKSLFVEPTERSIGLNAVDQVNTEVGVKSIKPLFPSHALKTQFAERHRAWGFHLWFELELDDDQNILEVINKYASLTEIEVAEPVFHKRIVGYNPEGFMVVNQTSSSNNSSTKGKWIPNDPLLDQQWHYNNTGQQGGTPDCDIDLFEAWEVEQGSSGVIVAIIDGGIEHAHPDLQANMWEGIGYNFVTNSPTIAPHNHGTHVAGTISANNNNGVGVAGIAGGSGSGDGVRLMSCQVFGPNNTQGGFSMAPVWAADNGANISQNSWGYTSPNVYDQATLDAIDYFNQNAGDYEGSPMVGGITIFAAGNDSQSGQWYPGCYSGAFAVAGMNNQDKVSWYTNYDTWVDISAPGGETNSVNARGVLSTITGSQYAFYQGTSMACPHVSGVAALILSHIPGEIGPDELKDMLMETTDDHYHLNPGYEGMLGAGRLNALNAIQEAAAMLNGIKNPKNFKAESVSSSQINLSWLLNDDANPVILAYNTEPSFGIPSVTAQVGNNIPGGGQVIYVGSASGYSHNNLQSVTPYYYRIWSLSTATNDISTGRNASAITHCASFSLPLEEAFMGPNLPMCWEAVSFGANDIWSYSHTNKSGGQTGEIKAKWVAGTGTSRLITPAINTQGVNLLTLKFKHFIDSYSSGLTFRIETSTDGQSWNAGPWQVQTSSSNIGPEEIEVDITQDVNSQSTYIAFVIDGNHYQFNNWYIDDVEVDGIPVGAPVVQTNVAFDITSNSAKVGGTITDQGNAPVSKSGVVYSSKPNPKIGSAGTTVKYTQPVVTQGNFVFSLFNLKGGERYYYRAFAENEITLSYADQKSFVTECGDIKPDYTQGFDTQELPPCWDNVSNTPDPTQIWQFGVFANGLNGSNSYAYLNSDGYGSGKTQNADLISPPIDVDNYKSITISFKHYFRSYSSSKATFKYSVNGGQTWETVSTWNTSTSNPSQFQHTFNNIENIQEMQFAWNYTGTWAYYWSVDDVVITGQLSGTLPEVQTLEPVFHSSTAVELRGLINPNGTQTAAQFQWGETNIDELTFDMPETLAGGDNIEISHLVSNLEPGTLYAYRLKAENEVGEVFGEVIEFVTWATGVELIDASSIELYPVPASSHIYIYNAKGQKGDFYIYSLTGQLLHVEKLNAATQYVDVSIFPSGVYILKAHFANGETGVIKFIKN